MLRNCSGSCILNQARANVQPKTRRAPATARDRATSPSVAPVVITSSTISMDLSCIRSFSRQTNAPATLFLRCSGFNRVCVAVALERTTPEPPAAIPVNSDNPAASKSLWLKPLFTLRRQCNGTGTIRSVVLSNPLSAPHASANSDINGAISCRRAYLSS